MLVSVLLSVPWPPSQALGATEEAANGFQRTAKTALPLAVGNHSGESLNVKVAVTPSCEPTGRVIVDLPALFFRLAGRVTSGDTCRDGHMAGAGVCRKTELIQEFLHSRLKRELAHAATEGARTKE